MLFTALPQISDGFEGLIRSGGKIRKGGKEGEKKKRRDGRGRRNTPMK